MPKTKTRGTPPKRRPLLDAKAACDYSGVPESLLRRLAREKRIAHIKTKPGTAKGGRLLFDPDDLDAWVDASRVAAQG